MAHTREVGMLSESTVRLLRTMSLLIDVTSHINSVDKNSEGDYLLSTRYTNAIYKVSGKDGSIVWQLGGDHNSFVMDGFNFSKQHDARFIEQNATTTIISFLDNASD